MPKEDGLLKELGNLYSIEPYEEVGNIKERSNEIASLLINLQNKDEIAPIIKDAFNISMESDIPVVLYNVTKNSMAKLCCLGTDTECCIVFPYMKEVKIFEVLDLSLEVRISNGSRMAILESDGYFKLSPPNEFSEIPFSVALFPKLLHKEKARIIEKKIKTGITKEEDRILAQRNTYNDSSKGSLPEHQIEQNYVRLELDDKVMGTEQELSNHVLMEVVLMASYNPNCKYLKVTSLGAGFSPAKSGKLQWDDVYERGCFQSEIEIHIEANENELATKESSPVNANNVTEYTTSSSISVGINISTDPGFESQYTLSKEESHAISDFEITNRSYGTVGDWDFRFEKAQGHDWEWNNMFEDQFATIEVKNIPILTKNNLQPVCVMTWVTDDVEFKKMVPLELGWKATYYHFWVKNFFFVVRKAWQYQLYSCSVPWIVDFGKVWVEP
ncbi:hypothetical protein BGV40_05030 [Methanosarcina sp. Ant1]|nr:hypothetical protein BGV40_05030 [Methanosarcina sp. Ant1]